MQAANSSLWNWKNTLQALNWWPRIWFGHSRHAVESICSTCQYKPDDVEQAGTTHANTVKASCAASPESRGILQKLKRASLCVQNSWKLIYMLGLCVCTCSCNERSSKQVKWMRGAHIAVSRYLCIHLESGVSLSSNTNQSSHTET